MADICRMTDDQVQSRKASAATPDGDSRPAMRNIPERPSQRTSTSLEPDVDISSSRARVNTSGVSRSSPTQPPFRSRKSLTENLSTGNRRVNPDRACQSPNFVYTLQEEGTLILPLTGQPSPRTRQQTGARRSGPSSRHFSMIAAAGDSFLTHLGVLHTALPLRLQEKEALWASGALQSQASSRRE
jgi:hypothetical protein